MEKKRNQAPAGHMMLRNHVPLQSTEEMPEKPEESCVPRCASTKGPREPGMELYDHTDEESCWSAVLLFCCYDKIPCPRQLVEKAWQHVAGIAGMAAGTGS